MGASGMIFPYAARCDNPIARAALSFPPHNTRAAMVSRPAGFLLVSSGAMDGPKFNPTFDTRVIYRVAEAIARHVVDDPHTPGSIVACMTADNRRSVCELALAALTAAFEEQVKLEIQEPRTLELVPDPKAIRQLGLPNRSLATAYGRLDRWEGDKLVFIIRPDL